MSTDTDHTQPDSLRAQLVDQLREQGHIRTAAVDHAMRTVARHHFLPGFPLDEAYANKNVVTKTANDGTHLSSASTPSVVAMMLEQLDLHPGHRVLEIGAGTGYNAALLRELVGEAGKVTTVDLDPDVAIGARTALGAAGYTNVEVAIGDGTEGWSANAPYDRVIVTAGAWDLPRAWREQLVEGGRIVVPLRFRGLTRSIVFERQDDRLRSRAIALCGFMPMRGPSGDGERSVPIAEDDVVLHIDEDQPITSETLHRVLDQPTAESWSGVPISATEPFHEIWLHLATTEVGTCRITARPAAVQSGLAKPAIPALSPAVAEGASLAYLTVRALADPPESSERRYELGAIGHGPAGQDLTTRITEQIRAWDRDRTAQPMITAVPKSTPASHSAEEHVIDKRHTRLVLSW